MASLQTKLENANGSLRRKLFDNQIKLNGITANVTRIKLSENDYKDSEITIVSKDQIDCIIKYPGEIPIVRTRPDNFTNANSSENPHLFLFDILPVDIWTKWDNNVERYDILIHKIKTEDNQYMKIVLQVSEVVGDVRSSLLYKKIQAAPMNSIPEQIQKYIDSL